jgi:hypothetical protein
MDSTRSAIGRSFYGAEAFDCDVCRPLVVHARRLQLCMNKIVKY